MSITSGLRSGLQSGMRSGINASYSGAPSAPTWQAVGTVQRGTAGLTPTWPTHAAGDVAILTVINSHSASMSAATLGTASGFVAVTGGSIETTSLGGLVTRITLFWCRASGGAQAAPVTVANGSWSNAWITTVRGAIASGDPTDDVDGSVQTTADNAISVAGNTTTDVNRIALVLAGGIGSGDLASVALTNGTLTGFTEQLDDQGVSGTERTIATVYTGTKATAGGTGTASGTFSATYCIWAAMSLALKAA